MTRLIHKYLIIFFLASFPLLAAATGIDFNGKNLLIGNFIDVLVDSTDHFTFKEVTNNSHFTKSLSETPNFGVSKFSYWFRIKVNNHSTSENLLLELAYPMLEYATLYDDDSSGTQTVKEKNIFTDRNVKHEDIVFKLQVRPGSTKTYYLKIRGNEQIVLPLILSTSQGFIESSLTREIMDGIHIGILLVMILYNLFVYFSIKDRSYLYYVLYILFIGLTQTAITGYTFKYLWPNQPYFNHISIILFPALAGSIGLIFISHFLHAKEKIPTLNKLVRVVIFVYAIAVVFRLIGDDRLSYRMIDFNGLLATLLALVMGITLALRNFRPAKFFLVAWTMFLVGIILFVLRNLNILPYNNFTNYTMQAGTALEVILLSFALADKINILTSEKDQSQKRALEISIENQRIISEQNIMLEEKVTERTTELTFTNNELQSTLSTLKNTQTQLVDAEKMASLGQLTAGIAHEINNPINFVSSNIKPLKRDIDDLLQIVDSYEKINNATDLEQVKKMIGDIEHLKKELDLDYLKTELTMLLDGMQDGAHRTVEIIRGLKIFSRLDESDLKFANINAGIQSTLIILNYQFGTSIKLIRELGNLPDIECYAGKLNQVFMNILSNAIFATQNNPASRPGVIWVTTSMLNEEQVRIIIRDNGTGMTPEVKNKIFEPFFTTKDVGKGTGLGLSIVFQIIEMHQGSIQVNTAVDEGTEFIIDLPIVHKTKNA